MDPYLEHPTLFPGLHNRLIGVLSEFLQARLPPPYYAEIGERVWVEVSRQFIEPEVTLLERGSAPGRKTGGAAVLRAVRGRAVVVTVPHDERRETFVEIRARHGDAERVVTAIEVLSPINKTPGERARDLYLRKQTEILETRAHLVEIDLLRAGVNTTAVPLDEARAAASILDYHVYVHRFDRFDQFVVMPVHLDEALPEVAIPLLPEDGDVVVDLQAVFDRCYDTGPYLLRVRYGDPVPPPPLRPEQAVWVGRVLESAGLAGPSTA
jgi:hypothetical protein